VVRHANLEADEPAGEIKDLIPSSSQGNLASGPAEDLTHLQAATAIETNLM
jgi:hypothetical protein